MNFATKHRVSAALSLLAGLTVLGMAAPSYAQVQIPNPLMRPQPPKLTPVSDPHNLNSPLPQGSAPAPAPTASSPANVPPPVSSSDFLRTAPASSGESKPDATVTELRQRFDGYYVSATVGDQAVLRRAATVAAAAPQASAAPSISAMPPRPSQSALGTVGRAESMVVRDGEPIEFLGSSVTLVPKVNGGRVSLYYYSDAATNKKKRSPSAQVVFLGQVESQAPATTAQIVLEKPDPGFKASISPEIKGMTNGSTTNGSLSPAMNGVPGPIAMPAY
ncbi:hypothetical protein [Noviherbaspirillum pedocola]|uniref:Uncharacterized protein n=1 Tax=Noviherbaspirillum pedocola TaxID=2801341 RepID=A0A934SYI7_9BURK|nr:hypothetical protein [Noviherbaspirillum pedocola]MBK4738900.1 hypothetical protein [Noviherbaspirillum pedocola]